MTEQIQNKIIIAVAGQDRHVDFADFGLTFESNDTEILESIGPMVHETFNVNIMDRGQWLYKVRRALDNQNIYIIPNSTAGSCFPQS